MSEEFENVVEEVGDHGRTIFEVRFLNPDYRGGQHVGTGEYIYRVGQGPWRRALNSRSQRSTLRGLVDVVDVWREP